MRFSRHFERSENCHPERSEGTLSSPRVRVPHPIAFFWRTVGSRATSSVIPSDWPPHFRRSSCWIARPGVEEPCALRFSEQFERQRELSSRAQRGNPVHRHEVRVRVRKIGTELRFPVDHQR